MIFLNAEKFFEEAIESVLAQTYDNWELLLVDDGSTDNSTEIALRYAKQHPSKVRYLEHEGHQNRGMSASRNLGVSNARGQYIALLDADDIWLPQKLEKQVAILEAQPEAAMVYSSTYQWFSWTGDPETAQLDFKRPLGVQPDTLLQPPKLLISYLEGKAFTPGTCSVLIRHEAIQDVGGFEEFFRGLYEDQIFFFKLCLKAPVFVESGCWDRYRQHPSSCCQVAISQGQFHPLKPNDFHLTVLNWLEKYLSEQEVKDTEVWQALKKAMWPYHYPTLYRLSQYAQQLKEGGIKRLVKSIARKVLPASIRSKLQSRWKGTEYCPPVGMVKFGDLRRVTPLSRVFGFDRGLPIDRYYIEKFLATQADDIRGRVLEIGDNFYTRKFGGERVTKSDVLHVVEGNPDATIVGDLTNADLIPSDTFDCLVLTQTLHLIYDVQSALKTIERILKPGGIALITFPGISQICIDEWKDYWCWGFTHLSAQRLFEEVFPKTNLTLQIHGNVLAATAFLQGIAAQELRKEELDSCDPSYQVLITVRAMKP
ncbi:glycosyltransferase [Scytonema sp. NUACC21]